MSFFYKIFFSFSFIIILALGLKLLKMNGEFKMSTFNDFLETVEERNREYVSKINDFLLSKGCGCAVKSAKSGFVVSYLRGDSKKTLMNFVMRKSGVQVRVYAARAGEYGDVLDMLPEKIKSKVKNSTDCRKLNGTGDDPKCPGGYEFVMDGEVYKKCRNSAFFFPMSEENAPFVKMILEKELGV